MYNLLFAGFGNVGQACAQLLMDKEEELKSEYGFSFKTVGIVDKLKGSVIDNRGIDLKKALALVSDDVSLEKYPEGDKGIDVMEAIDKTDANVFLEATYTDIKTGEPATSYIKKAINKKMHVVTTNKGPVALFYNELKNMAESKGVKFLFEGTVISGTPMLNLIRETMKGMKITSIQGILNGTTNYILTRMEEEMPYKEALREAQNLGYAEAVPDADVKGWDALAKTVILANVVFKTNLKPSDILCEGITEITNDEIAKAKSEGKRIKLIASIIRKDEDVFAEVRPVKIDLAHPLASVSGSTNALTITSDVLGDVTISGPGAGRTETGYSMLIDLLSLK